MSAKCEQQNRLHQMNINPFDGNSDDDGESDGDDAQLEEKYADKEFGGKFGFSAEGRKRWLGANAMEKF